MLRLTSCQADNALSVCRALADYVAHALGLAAEFVEDVPWQERQRQLFHGHIAAGWICGLPYVWQADGGDPTVELLAAPVMAGARYQQRPIYYSDVVVRRDSPFHTFADLRGATWAYNEPDSHSGCHLVHYHLATLGEAFGFFSRVVESGAHQTSLRMVLARQADASAIDSTVLETELRGAPGLAGQVRVIATLGPSPAPPWVVSKRVPEHQRAALRHAFLRMQDDPRGRAVLEEGRLSRFVAVEDREYDPIRRMARLATRVRL